VKKEAAVLSARIESELKDIFTLIDRIKAAWRKARDTEDDFYLDSVALNLHGLYSGLERIFEKIASIIDGSVPTGVNWHQELLNQMAVEVPRIRPAVISIDLKDDLEEYRGFRHVVRNVYTYRLDPDKLRPLVKNINKIWEKIDKELSAFAKFIRGVE
jgi:hypothetical protein